MRRTALLSALAALATGPLQAGPLEAGPLAVVQLQFRDYAVLVHAGADARYTIFDRDGRLVAEALTLDQVFAYDRDLHEQLANLVAGRSFIWAGQ